MPNTRPLKYTERLPVRFQALHRDKLRAYALRYGVGVSTFLRSAALHYIGRSDLIDATPPWGGPTLERTRTPRGPAGTRKRVTVSEVVNLSRAQLLAIELEAELRWTAPAALVREAALAALGIALPKPARKRARGRPLGAPNKRS